MNSDLSEKTSKRLYELRTNAGYTMEKLASMLNVSKGTISKWEKGSIKNMRQDKVLMLANIFHVSPTYIMGYDEPAEKVSVMKSDANYDASSSREAKLVALYGNLSPSQQTLVDNMLVALAEKQENYPASQEIVF